eukprot:3411215-Lingulodinium_polyedra.AAC.1
MLRPRAARQNQGDGLCSLRIGKRVREAREVERKPLSHACNVSAAARRGHRIVHPCNRAIASL